MRPTLTTRPSRIFTFFIPVVPARLVISEILISRPGARGRSSLHPSLSTFDDGPDPRRLCSVVDISALGQPRRPELPELVDASR
jgi:hypothetical protein